MIHSRPLLSNSIEYIRSAPSTTRRMNPLVLDPPITINPYTPISMRSPDISREEIIIDRPILLVEENPINAKIASTVLRCYLLSVVIVGNGAVALQKIVKAHDSFHLILMGIRISAIVINKTLTT